MGSIFPDGCTRVTTPERVVGSDRNLNTLKVLGTSAKVGDRHDPLRVRLDHADPGKFQPTCANDRLAHSVEELILGSATNNGFIALAQRCIHLTQFANFFIRSAAFGDVAGDAENADDLAGGIAHFGACHLGP